MLRTTLATLVLLVGTSGIVSAEDASENTKEVKHKTLTLKVPKNWKQTPARNSMRLATYEIPGVKGDEEKAELTIFSFPGGGGSVEANIARWVGQFDSKGRETHITKGKTGDNNYYVVEVSGTYNKSIGPPIRRQTEAVEGSRMLAVILELDSGVFFLKMTGRDKTVKAQAKALRTAFGGKIEGEEEHAG